MSELVLAPWRRAPGASLRLYLGFARLAFLKYLAYRLRYYTGVVSYTIFVTGNAYLFRALFASRPETAGGVEIGGFTLPEMITYIAVSWIGRSFMFNNIDRTLAHQIQQGEIAMQLIKPFHVQTVTMFEAAGEAGFRLLLFTLPIMIVVVPLFDIGGPPRAALYGWTLLSFLLGMVINCQLNFLVGCLAFYLKNIDGVIRAKAITLDFLAGVLVPFSFFPGWVQTLAAWLPFQGLSYVPVMIYLGKRAGPDLASALLVQAAWAIGLFLAGRLLWARAVRSVTLQGG
ncbi:MAG TPA: ABC-2 family transporter protein [Candidatus Krumholzibacteria bacterium]|nr:ABC-2 family transporter protein [Candidatus Krumholzibacteria bacterium]HPD71145.1 ABC-2 family transporter protein [Candidatus Krumholzibacteria bacterium]HRY39155.1 ABC-2 family transporter protein [Candidatus Krumholzibacteria bacterium]